MDPVLFAAHSLGFFMYTRNILLYYGRKGLFSRLEKIPFFSKLFNNVSDKIK
jgi:hypothetical protein